MTQEKPSPKSTERKPITQATLAEAAREIFAKSIGQPQGGAVSLSFDPEKIAATQSAYFQRLSTMFFEGAELPKPTDRRFKSPEWQEGPLAWNAALYELNSQLMAGMAQSMQGDAKQVERFKFTVDQMIDAMSPANFLATNPEAQEAFRTSGGASLQEGMQNLMQDIAKGSISQTDEDAFEVGENLAVTPGSVVFENELIQLIQYKPSTARVGSVPMLIVPPCINKFYILDLQPENSVVAWLVAQGHTVFLVSWRNCKADQGHLSWDDYLESGVVSAIRTTRDISGVEQINALGFCVGGTLTTTALAALAARGEHPVQSLTLLTTLLDFEEPGVLNILIDEAHVAMREATLGQGGIVPGADLAQTFSSLRPNDLIWNYVSRNYLQGQKPPAFDLLYWNADSTNLPGPAFVWYLRHMYLQNELREPDRLTCLGESIDLGSVDMPVFIYGSRDDHIVPWQAAYASRQVLGGETEFVLGASGHIAGVINPPGKNKRNYWVSSAGADDESTDADQWFESAESVPGSWWTHWGQWLSSRKGKSVVAPKKMGDKAYKVIEPAPGRYVRERG